MKKNPFPFPRKLSLTFQKNRNSKAFEAWSVCFYEAHPPITELEMLSEMVEEKREGSFSRILH